MTCVAAGDTPVLDRRGRIRDFSRNGEKLKKENSLSIWDVLMGCDIHILFQVWVEGSEKWFLVWKNPEDGTYMAVGDSALPDANDEEYNDRIGAYWFSLDRDYLLFSKIANVRNVFGLLNVKKAKGYPGDISERILNLIWGYSYHSHTWLADDELDEINMTEIPVTKTRYFIRASDYEFIKVARGDEEINEKTLLRINDGKLLESSASGIFYGIQEWDTFDIARKIKEETRPRDFLWLEGENVTPRSMEGVEEFKRLVLQIKDQFHGMKVRALICFDS
jgi:hypothetical protein